jgi:hypothetical protein
MAGLGYTFKDGDWTRLRQIIQKMSSLNFGYDASPTFSSLTLTSLTGPRLIGASTGSTLSSEDLFDWVAGTANQITVTDDTDGTITLSIPATLQVTTSGQFGTLTCASGSITDTSGAISFGDENLTTTGMGSFSYIILTDGANNFSVGKESSVGSLSWTAEQDTSNTRYGFYTYTGDGDDINVIDIYGIGNVTSEAVRNRLTFGYAAAQFLIRANASGVGTTYCPLNIETQSSSGLNTNQILLNIDGSVNMNTGNLIIPSNSIVLGDTTLSGVTFFSMTGPDTISFTCNDGEFFLVGSNNDIDMAFLAPAKNNGLFSWMVDEDYFQFADDVFMSTGEAVMFEATTTKLQYGNTGDLDVYTPANKTLELQTVVYKDENISGALLVGNPTQVPGTDQFKDSTGADTGIETFAFAVDEGVHGGFELQHDYKEGTDLVFHVHWQGIAAPSGTDNVQWRLTYIVARDDSVLAAAVTFDSPDTAIDTQYEVYRTDFAAITGTNFKIGDQFMFSLERVAATGDAYEGDALIFTAGIHYQIDTLGSRHIGTK